VRVKEKDMSKPISVARLKKNLQNRPEAIERMYRVLPRFIQEEVETTNNPKVIKSLTARLKMVSELMMEIK
jgi:pyoverdine/dityrosine biosynthesis protein Dit1